MIGGGRQALQCIYERVERVGQDIHQLCGEDVRPRALCVRSDRTKREVAIHLDDIAEIRRATEQRQIRRVP